MHKKRSIFSALHAILCVLFFLYSTAFAQENSMPSPCDLTRSLGVNIITKPGFYFISRTVPTTLKIRSSDVVLELAGNTVLGGIDIGSNIENVTIQNGIIDGAEISLADGIKANFGSTNITLKDLYIKNSTCGVSFDNVTGGLIRNCEFTLNDTGVDFADTHNIIVENTVASANRFTGFGLLRSTTCLFQDCKALSIGDGNTNITDNEVFGFVSTDGYANIFERCIANSTQALSTTDSSSVIAGFALRGDEQCTKIIECESTNTQTNEVGFTVPYGILLESAIDPNLTLTALPTIPDLSAVEVERINFSPDGKYLALSCDDTICIYELDRQNFTLTEVARNAASESFSVDWHPSGNFILASQPNTVYKFDRINHTLEVFGTSSIDSQRGAIWMPDGKHFAGGQASTLRIFSFDTITGDIEQVASVASEPFFDSVAVSPDGRFIATAAIYSGSEFELFLFDGNTGLTRVAFDDPAPGNKRSVDWSPDGKYLAATSSALVLYIYEFNPDTFAFNVVSSRASSALFAKWSSDGKHIVGGTTSALNVFEFDRGSNTLTKIAENTIGDNRFVDISPDGGFIAASSGNPNGMRFFQAFSFPSNNVIKDNIVYCNSGGSIPSGIGISGSSISNMIIGNTAYANPISPHMVGQNYAFVTNIFNQLFGQGPTSLQNISLDCDQPICTPDDIALLLKQAKLKACSFIDEITDTISLVENLQAGSPCAPTPVNASPIAAEGFYCLQSDIAGGLAINASNVVLNLNGRTVIGGISFTGRDNITLMNGVVQNSGSDGISATNSTNIMLQNVTVKNSLIGVNFNQVVGGLVENCTFTLNTTGLELDTSAKITIDSCEATCNTNTGYCLLSSTTCYVINSKALSTGEGNNNITDQTIFGFVSTDGNANIFERCIANSTQALSTTDFNSIVAGFALRGSESCTKIIDSESANTQTNENGFTVPHGILLQSSLGLELTLTAVPFLPNQDSVTAAWSPDGAYLATADGMPGKEIRVYKFDYQNLVVTQVASTESGDTPDGQPVNIAWSHSGDYLAIVFGVTDSYRIRIYQFDRDGHTIKQIAVPDVIPVCSPQTVAWSPDDRFIVIAGNVSAPSLYVYSFDLITKKLTELISNSIASTATGVDWSPDGKFIALAGATSPQLRVFEFNAQAPSLSVFAVPSGADIPDDAQLVKWSPNGNYLLLADQAYSTDTLKIYVFNRDTGSPSLDLIAGALPGGSIPQAIDWSADGRYVAGGFDAADYVRVFEFDPATPLFTLQASSNVDLTAVVEDLRWSSDGSYLVAFSDQSTINIYRALSFPGNNVIKNNTIYCNSGGSIPSGIGISGSSITNLIIGNTAYCNPINPFMVGQNYAFVTNVFNPLFENDPTSMENISLDCNQPICMPGNIALLIQQACAKVVSLGQCGPTTVTSSDISGGTIAITASGNYCLGEDVTADLSITATCVSFDMNGRCLSGELAIATSDDVIVKNGTILASKGGSASPPAALTLNDTVNRVSIDRLVIVTPDETVGTASSRDGIQCAGNNCQIVDCTISTGNAGSSATPGSGGSGIVLKDNATKIIIRGCVLQTGNGGNSSGATAGGSGGDGIRAEDGADTVEIVGCVISKTGNGGDSVSGSSGDGGHAIQIDDGAVDVAVRECTMSNTGTSGAGSTIGMPGKAVFDRVTTTANVSLVFKNYAYNIANPTKFDMQAATAAGGPEDGILSPNPPDSTVLNPFANVFTVP